MKKKIIISVISFILLISIFSSCGGNGAETDSDAGTESLTEALTEPETIEVKIPEKVPEKQFYEPADGIPDGALEFTVAGESFFRAYGSAAEQENIKYKKLSNEFISVELDGELVPLTDKDIEFYIMLSGKNTGLCVKNNCLPYFTYNFRFETRNSYYSFPLSIDNINVFELKTVISNENAGYGIPNDTSGLLDAWAPYNSEEHKRGITYTVEQFDYLVLKEIFKSLNNESIKATLGEFVCIIADPAKAYITKGDFNAGTYASDDNLMAKFGVFFTCCEAGPYVWITDIWRKDADRTLEDGMYNYIYKYSESAVIVLHEYLMQNFNEAAYDYGEDLIM